jgi:hypothetical protein
VNTVILIVCATVVAIVWLILRRPKTEAAGEICVRTGMWECSFCGELKPISKGERVPACDAECVAHEAKWRYVRRKP